ncbi:MAG TPA: hypothetical protein VHH73_09680, partial [Verrucomicrobiae bacterium]|nr:hypothetical protein [Verrucomicrobiae bacterium]
MPVKSLPSSPSLDHLKYQAKDLLASFHAGNPEALARVREFHPKHAGQGQPPPKFALGDAQWVIAREYGFESWPKLKLHLESLTGAAPGKSAAVSPVSPLAQVAQFLEFACPDHHVRGGFAHVMARNAAARMLRRHPEITRDNLYTSVVCGELDEVNRILATRPEAANEKPAFAGPDRSGSGNSDDLFKDNGPKLWEPLLYLCFTRLPIPAVTENSVAIAQALLDRGANPNAFFMAGDSRYTPLVGVIGEGEESRPAHTQRDALARLLLERGANPFDIQVVYNIHFRGDVLWFLKLAHEQSVNAGREAAWQDPA